MAALAGTVEGSETPRGQYIHYLEKHILGLISILELGYLLVVAESEAPALIRVCTTSGWPYKEAQ